MKVKVIHRFFDKVECIYVEKEVEGKPNIIERDDERARELIAVGVCEEIAEAPKKAAKKTKKTE